MFLRDMGGEQQCILAGKLAFFLGLVWGGKRERERERWMKFRYPLFFHGY